MFDYRFSAGDYSHWLSDGGGEVGVYPTHRNIIDRKKKLGKKKLFEIFLHMSFILLIFASLNLGPS